MIKKYFSLNLLVLFLFSVDRIVKYWLIKNPEFNRDFIVSWLRLELQTNRGIAFGWLVWPGLILILTILIGLFLVGWLIREYKGGNSWLILALTMITAGAISNLIDRLKFGYVIDYINVPFFTIFNLADVMITTGVALIIIKELFLVRSLDKNQPAS